MEAKYPTHHCLNCGFAAVDKFCSKCGQKTDTHRITAKHFLLHDLVHGVWHLDKGIPYTIKQTFIRPGYAARDYIAGKRVRYYNIFYLILLVFGLVIVVGNYVEGGVVGVPGNNNDADFNKLIDIVAGAVKIFYLSMLPLLALNGFLIFRKTKLNFYEHLIIIGFVFLGMLLLVFVGMLLSIPQNSFLDVLNNIVGGICFAFPAFVYYQAVRAQYTIMGLLWRIVAFYALFYLQFQAIKEIGLLIIKSLA